MTKEQLQEIEERAILFDYNQDAHKAEGFSGVRQEAYIQGATDQDPISRADERKKCIEKACTQFCKSCKNNLTQDFFMCDVGYKDKCAMLNNFKKAMEE